MEELERKPTSSLIQSIVQQVHSRLDHGSGAEYVEDSRNLQCICERVWVEFSQRNQKSPSRRNNNVHRNEAPSLRRPSRFRTILFPTTNHGQADDPHRTSGLCGFDEMPTAMQKRAARESIVYGYFLPMMYFFAACLITYCGITYNRSLLNFVSRNIQDYIYPFMRFSRLMAVPLLKTFPFLTNIYEESCLLTNPNFGVSPSECWPCENARSIVDLTGLSNLSSAFYTSGMPFFVKDSFDEAGTELAVQAVVRHYYGRRDDDPSLENQSESWLSDFVNKNSNEGHFVWKINQVSLARMLRQYFPKPYFIPRESEVSVQHFLFVDTFNASDYHFPMTEFANVFIMQVQGARIIRLAPAGNCQLSCRTLNMILSHNEVLYYNWLYWRATSRPAVTGTSVGITYLGSFY